MMAIYGSATENHFGAVLTFEPATHAEFDTGRTRSVGKHLAGQGTGAQCQVGAVAGRIEKGDRGAATAAVALGNLIQTETFLGLAVEIGIQRETAIRGGIEEHRAERIDVVEILDRERSIRTVQRRRTALLLLRAQEIWKYLGE